MALDFGLQELERDDIPRGEMEIGVIGLFPTFLQMVTDSGRR